MIQAAVCNHGLGTHQLGEIQEAEAEAAPRAPAASILGELCNLANGPLEIILSDRLLPYSKSDTKYYISTTSAITYEDLPGAI